MGVFNEILSPRFARALQKLFSMKGHPPVKSLGGELLAGISMFYGAECRYLEGWNKIGGRMFSGAVAANSSAARLLNPTGSGVLAVIEKVSFAGPTVALATIERPASNATFPLVGNQLAFDKRGASAGGLADGICLLQGKNNNATTFGITVGTLAVQVAGTQGELIFTDIQEFPLLPGDSFDMTSNTVNVALDVTIWWRERPLEDSEKT